MTDAFAYLCLVCGQNCRMSCLLTKLYSNACLAQCRQIVLSCLLTKNKNTLLPVDKKKKKKKNLQQKLLPVDKTVPVSFLLGDRQACAVIWKMRARVTPVMPTPAVRHRPLMATLFARVGKAGAELTAPLTSMNVKKVSILSYSFFILE